MSDDVLVLMARSRRLHRIRGLPDMLALELRVLVPPGRTARTIVVEQRLSRRDAERLLAAFDAPPTKAHPASSEEPEK